MVKKRLVVFGILFIILFSLAKAEEDISTSPTLDRYNSFLIACKGCDGASLGDEMVCNSPNSGYDPDRETGCAFLHEGDSVEFPDKADPDECSSALKNGFGSSITRPSGQGCWVFVAEEDAGEDDCAYLLPIEGTIINGVNPTNLFYVNPTIYDILSFQSDDLFEDWSWGAAEDSKDMIVYYDWILDVSESYICADGGYWDRCFSSDAGHPDGNIGVKTWVDGLLYECVEEENSVPTWSVLGQDLDHDSYTSDIDCIDSPSQLPSSITIPDDCPTTETIDDCYQLKYSTCPLCINPSAPEVCGDGINNDCRGDDGVDGAMTFSTADDLDGKTPDDCDLFKEGCEQKTFENVADSQTEEGEEQTPVQHRNVDDGYYSWIDTLEGGYCCGYADGEADKSSDVGLIKDLLPPEGSEQDIVVDAYLCLPSQSSETGEFGDENIVGHTLADGEIEHPGWKEAGCDGGGIYSPKDWCWLPAASKPFRIMSINDPDEDAPYDVVSNNERWVECRATDENSDPTGPNSISTDVSSSDYIEEANRFYCFDEGNRWSWAECLSETSPDETALSNNVAKTRVAGDGLFGLTLKRPSIHSAEVDMDHYHDYYGDTIVSAEGYTHLEFMVKYTDEVKFPARLLLTISGPAEDRNDDENIMRKNVLGDITNNAYLTPGEWYHIKTKIPDGLQSIKSLTIASIPITNTIEVKNIYFSKEGDTPLCSGIGSDLNPTHLDISEEQASSWITDIDHYDPNSFLNGEDLCNALYDPEAKLAWIEENEELDIDAMCCGNDQGEYASGNVRGCWNSVVVEDQQSVGNVEINVQYKEKEYDIDYIGYYPYDLEFEYEFVGTISEADKEVYITSFNTFNRENFKFYYEGDVENRYPVVQFWACFFRGVVTPYCNTGLDVVLSSITIKDTLNLNLEMEAKDNNDNWVVLANNKLILSSFGEEEYIDIRIVPTEKLDANRAQSKYFLRATELPMVPITDEALTKKTFTCTSNECVFPLPGESDPAEEAIDYTITNNNPGMYDLYLVLGPGLKDEILLSEQTTEIDIDPLYDRFNSEDSIGAPAANLRVKRVPQNVVYVKDTDPDYPDKFHYQFYGCNAGLQEQSTLSDQEYNDLLFCDVKGEYFCSFSETEPHPEEADDIPYLTTIGTWSKQTLPEFGYKPVPEDTTVENMDERLELRAPEGEQETESKNRNMPSPILPGRNILPNPYFTEIKPPELLYWDIFDLVGDGLYQKVETENRHPQDIPESELSEEETIIPRSIPLTATQMLLSDRIAIPQGATLRFSYEGSCDDVQAILYDTSNPSATAPTKITLNAAGTSFNTGTNSYVSFQFSGSCTIQYPLLQLDDGKGIAEFSYNLRYPSKQKPRAAAACCPTNYCWNGFTCVEPMTDDTLIAEHVGEDRNYRCIEGSWVELPLLSDWNAEKQGFCSFENQCFILSSRNTEIIDTEDKIIAEMPKEGSEQINFHQQTEITGVKFPTCINDSEFVLDHYCDQGDWTSRTKFLAGQLLEEAGSSDYSIYCSDPKAVLADFDGKEQQILGGGEGATLPSDSLIPGSVPSATSASCFPLPADPVAERLIPPEDNTCINSACILKHEAGNVIFATTLNKPINDDDSLLRAFDQHPSICGDDGVCATTESFVGELQYVPGINALIYGRDGISRPLSFVVFKDKVFDFLSDFFGREETLSSTLQFVQEADNFRDIYLLKADGKEVQAVKEVLPKTSPSSVSKHSIIADYTGFESPICAFLNARHLGSAWPADLLEPEKVNCVTIDDTQRVEISVTPGKKNLLNQIWPQLTGKLRPEVAG